MSARRAQALLAQLAVAMVLADSSIVTIALPDVLDRYSSSVPATAWVLIAYNLALALAAVPAAYLAARRPRQMMVVGLVAFGAASLTCGLAPSYSFLIAGRVIQALGGALVVGAGLAVLVNLLGSREKAIVDWARAGILGAAAGPAIGGIMTQGFGWEWIFIVQAPLALLALLSLRGISPADGRDAPGRPPVLANLAVALISGALTAALFLIALLLINGWRLGPAAAGATLTVMPIAAILAGRLIPPQTRLADRAIPGTLLICGGLAGLALLPRAGWAWTIAPQILLGAGLGLTLGSLTTEAISTERAPIVGAGWTIGARHLGVVAGLVLLTPVFNADLLVQTDAAIVAGAGVVLNSQIAPLDKLTVAQEVIQEISGSTVRVPDLRVLVLATGTEPAYQSLADDVQEQVDRAATHAFTRSFWFAAGIGLLSLVPLLRLAARRRSPS